jgi:hypothetical protein
MQTRRELFQKLKTGRAKQIPEAESFNEPLMEAKSAIGWLLIIRRKAFGFNASIISNYKAHLNISLGECVASYISTFIM